MRLAEAMFGHAILLCSLLLQSIPPAPDEVEALIRRGGELRKQGKDAAALPYYQRAHERAGTPRTAAQLGLVEVQLGYWLEAEPHLAESVAARGEPWIETYRTVLEGQLRTARSHIGELVVQGSPPGAEVIINGRREGALPLPGPVRLVAGPVRIQVTASGYTDGSAAIDLRGGGTDRVVLNLPRLGTAPLSPVNPPEDSKPWTTQKIVGGVILGAGIASIAGGATLLIFDKHDGCDAPAGAACSERLRTTVPGWSLIGAGVALTAVGGWLVYTSPAAAVAAGVGPRGIFVAGTFR